MTNPKPISVEEAREEVAKYARAMAEFPFDTTAPLLWHNWRRVLATAQAAERRWVPVTERLPEHIALDIQHNDHAATYESVERWIVDNDWCDWVSEEEKQRAIATNSVWTLRWYPNTPVGHHTIAASTLDAVLAAIPDQPEV